MSEIITVSDKYTVTILENNKNTVYPSLESYNVTISDVGVQGIQGPPGNSIAGSLVAGESISVYQVIVQGLDGKAYKADPLNISHVGKVLGVATTSATSNNIIQYTSGGTISGGSWSSGELYFVGLSGNLSNSPKASGALWSQFIGSGKSLNSFNVQVGIPMVVD